MRFIPSDTTRVANLALDLLEITGDHERRRVIHDLVEDDRLAVLGCLDAAHNELTGTEISEEPPTILDADPMEVLAHGHAFSRRR